MSLNLAELECSNSKMYEPWYKLFDTTEGSKLIAAFSFAKKEEDLKNLLSGLLTEYEANQLVRRFSATYWIYLGTPYRAINKITSMSQVIIARLSKRTADKKSFFRDVIRNIHSKGLPRADADS